MKDKRLLIRKLLLLLLCIVAGIILADWFWAWTPIKWKVDLDTRYLLAYGRGVELTDKGDYDGAQAAFLAAITLSTNRYEAHLTLGNLLLSRGETNAALACFDMALLFCGDGPTNLVPRELQVRERLRIAEKIQKLRSKDADERDK